MSFFQFGILPEYLHILWMRNFVLLRVSVRAFGVHHRCGVGDIWYLPTPTSKWFCFHLLSNWTFWNLSFPYSKWEEGMWGMGWGEWKKRPSHLIMNWCYDLLSWERGDWKYCWILYQKYSSWIDEVSKQ